MSIQQANAVAQETFDFVSGLHSRLYPDERDHECVAWQVRTPGVHEEIQEFYNQSPHHKVLGLLSQAGVNVAIGHVRISSPTSYNTGGVHPRQQITSFCAGDIVEKVARNSRIVRVLAPRSPEHQLYMGSVFGNGRRGTLWIHADLGGAYLGTLRGVTAPEELSLWASAIEDFTLAAARVSEHDSGPVECSSVTYVGQNQLWLGVTLRNKERHVSCAQGRIMSSCMYCSTRISSEERKRLAALLAEGPIRRTGEQCRGCSRDLGMSAVATPFRDDHDIDRVCGTSPGRDSTYDLIRRATARHNYRLLNRQTTSNMMGRTGSTTTIPMTHVFAAPRTCASPVTARKASLFALANEFIAGSHYSVMLTAPLGDARKSYETATVMADVHRYTDQLNRLGVEVLHTPALAQNPREHYHHVDSMVLVSRPR